MTEDLEARLARAARGRRVVVRHIPNSMFARDFSVRYAPDAQGYEVHLTAAGCFEEAYRFLERWVGRDAAQRDGTYEPPPDDYADFTDVAHYWMVERLAVQLLDDMEAAVTRYCEFLGRDTSRPPQLGDVVPAHRAAGLRGLARHFDAVRQEVRRAVLSPHSVEILRTAGILPHGDQ